MNLDDLEADLPWGFHDAYLERMAIDWIERRMTMDLRVMVSEHQDTDQRLRVTVTGLVFLVVDPPNWEYRVADDEEGEGLWIDSGPGAAGEEAAARLPPTPPGCFLHWFLVHGRYSLTHVCGKDASMEWIEPEPVAARAGTRALFPGDEIPDP